MRSSGPGSVGAQDFEALERALRRQVLGLAAQAMAQYFNADDTDHSDSTVAWACGGRARHVGRGRKTFTTLLGPLTLHRAYYHCAACRRGSCPRDRALGLQDTSLSPATVRLVGLAATSVSFAEASEWMGNWPAWRSTPNRSSAPPKRWAARSRPTNARGSSPHPPRRRRCAWGWTGPACRCASPRWKAGAASSRTAPPRPARSSSPPCGRRKHATPTASPNATPGRSASAAVESAASRPTDPLPSPFAQRAYREARRRGFDTAARRVLIGDGAEWVWNLAGEQFPVAIEIVDLYHAKGHLCDVAKAIHGAGTDLAAQWGKDRRDELDAGRIDAILTALHAHRETCEEARKCIDYLARNRHRMRYPEFRAAGLCVSSGVVEAGCKLAIGARLKRAGMHWTVAGANAIIALRCCKLSGRFEDFWGTTSRQSRLTVTSRI